MKKLGRKHRPFFRICAIDRRSPREGRVIEELGYYDPMCKEKDARTVLKTERIDYWISVGAQPSDRCATLIKKYGTNGSHLEQQQAAMDRLAVKPQAPAPVAIPLPKKEEPAPAAEAAPAAEGAAPAEGAEAAATEEAAAAPAEEAKPAEEAAAEAPKEEAKAEEPAAEAAPAEEKPADAAEEKSE